MNYPISSWKSPSNSKLSSGITGVSESDKLAGGLKKRSAAIISLHFILKTLFWGDRSKLWTEKLTTLTFLVLKTVVEIPRYFMFTSGLDAGHLSCNSQSHHPPLLQLGNSWFTIFSNSCSSHSSSSACSSFSELLCTYLHDACTCFASWWPYLLSSNLARLKIVVVFIQNLEHVSPFTQVIQWYYLSISGVDRCFYPPASLPALWIILSYRKLCSCDVLAHIALHDSVLSMAWWAIH